MKKLTEAPLSYRTTPNKSKKVHSVYEATALMREQVIFIGRRLVFGRLTDSTQRSVLYTATIINKNTLDIATALDSGFFVISAGIGDTIEITVPGFKTKTVEFNGTNLSNVIMEKEEPGVHILGGAIKGIKITTKVNTIEQIYNSLIDMLR